MVYPSNSPSSPLDHKAASKYESKAVLISESPIPPPFANLSAELPPNIEPVLKKLCSIFYFFLTLNNINPTAPNATAPANKYPQTGIPFCILYCCRLCGCGSRHCAYRSTRCRHCRGRRIASRVKIIANSN